MANTGRSLRVVTDTANLRERTTLALRNAILSLQFEPGEKLVERKLCDETGVSRTCVREALRHLEVEGLVRRVPNRGMVVTRLSADEARQIYEVRATLESAMGGYFVERATDRHVAAIEAAFARVEKTAFKNDVLAYAAALDRFSNALMEGAGNEVAGELLNMLRARITYLRTITAKVASKEQTQGTIDHLAGIVEALKNRDAKAAQSRCRAYVMRSAGFALSVLEPEENAAKASPGKQKKAS